MAQRLSRRFGEPESETKSGQPGTMTKNVPFWFSKYTTAAEHYMLQLTPYETRDVAALELDIATMATSKGKNHIGGTQ